MTMSFDITHAIEHLAPPIKAQLERLNSHVWNPPDLTAFPRTQLAAVLVLLYEEVGELRVLLTTRSKTLRTHAGQTAFPGGRMDESDTDLVFTAFREAFEEIGLPIESPHLHVVAHVDPFVSLHKLVVTPIVVLLTDTSLLSDLKASPDEVAHIFSHPLEAVLDPSLAPMGELVAPNTENWIYPEELHNTTDSPVPHFEHAMYRMHRFRTSASPLKGLTCDILIHVAQVAFARAPVYNRWAEGQPRDFADYSRLLGLP